MPPLYTHSYSYSSSDDDYMYDNKPRTKYMSKETRGYLSKAGSGYHDEPGKRSRTSHYDEGWDSDDTLATPTPIRNDEYMSNSRRSGNARASSDSNPPKCSRDEPYERSWTDREDSTDDGKVNCRAKCTGYHPSAGEDESSDEIDFTNEKWHKDKFLICLNFGGEMVVNDFLVSSDMLRRFEERFKEGDCLRLAQDHYGHKDDRALINFMKRVAKCHGESGMSEILSGDKPRKYRLGSYWLGWDPLQDRPIRYLGPCIGNDVVEDGAAPLQTEWDFMIAANFSPKTENGIIEGVSRTCSKSTPIPTEEVWHEMTGGLFGSKRDKVSMVHSLKVLKDLQEGFNHPVERLPIQASSPVPIATSASASQDRNDRVEEKEQTQDNSRGEGVKEKSSPGWDNAVVESPLAASKIRGGDPQQNKDKDKKKPPKSRLVMVRPRNPTAVKSGKGSAAGSAKETVSESAKPKSLRQLQKEHEEMKKEKRRNKHMGSLRLDDD